MNFENNGWDPQMDFNAQSKEQIDDMRRAIAIKSKQYQDIFINTQSGKQILEDLKEKFAHDACWHTGMTFEQSTYMEGQRSVITYLTRLINFKYEPPNE